MENHFETRQEYIKTGNELASLAEKQQKEKAEKEKKQLEDKMISMIPNTNNSNKNNVSNPMFIPQKQKENRKTADNKDPNMINKNNGFNKPNEVANGIGPLNNNHFSGRNSSFTRANNNNFKNNKY